MATPEELKAILEAKRSKPTPPAPEPKSEPKATKPKTTKTTKPGSESDSDEVASKEYVAKIQGLKSLDAAYLSADPAQTAALRAEEKRRAAIKSEPKSEPKALPAAQEKPILGPPTAQEIARRALIDGSPIADAQKALEAERAGKSDVILTRTGKDFTREPSSSILDALPIIGVAQEGEDSWWADMKRQTLRPSEVVVSPGKVQLRAPEVESPLQAGIRFLNRAPALAGRAYEEAMLVKVDPKTKKPIGGPVEDVKASIGRALYGEDMTPDFPVGRMLGFGLAAKPFQAVEAAPPLREQLAEGKGLPGTYQRLVSGQGVEGRDEFLEKLGFAGALALPATEIGLVGKASQAAGGIGGLAVDAASKMAASKALINAGVGKALVQAEAAGAKTATELVENVARSAVAKNSNGLLQQITGALQASGDKFVSVADLQAAGVKGLDRVLASMPSIPIDKIDKLLNLPSVAAANGWTTPAQLLRQVQAGAPSAGDMAGRIGSLKPTAEQVKAVQGSLTPIADLAKTLKDKAVAVIASELGAVAPRSAPTIPPALADTLEATVSMVPPALRNNYVDGFNRTYTTLKNAFSASSAKGALAAPKSPIALDNLAKELALRTEAAPYAVARAAEKWAKANPDKREEALAQVALQAGVKLEDLWEGLLGTAYEGVGLLRGEEGIVALTQTTPGLKALLALPPTPARVKQAFGLLDKAMGGSVPKQGLTTDVINSLSGRGFTSYILDEASALYKTKAVQSFKNEAAKLFEGDVLPIKPDDVNSALASITGKIRGVLPGTLSAPELKVLLGAQSGGQVGGMGGLPLDKLMGIPVEGGTVVVSIDSNAARLLGGADGIARASQSIGALSRTPLGKSEGFASALPQLLNTGMDEVLEISAEAVARGKYGLGPVPNVPLLAMDLITMPIRAAINGANVNIGTKITPDIIKAADELGVTITRLDDAVRSKLVKEVASAMEKGVPRRVWDTLTVRNPYSQIVDELERSLRLRAFASALEDGMTLTQAATLAKRALPGKEVLALSPAISKQLASLAQTPWVGGLVSGATAASAASADAVKALGRSPGAYLRFVRAANSDTAKEISDEAGASYPALTEWVKDAATPVGVKALGDALGVAAALRAGKAAQGGDLSSFAAMSGDVQSFLRSTFGSDGEPVKLSNEELVEKALKAYSLANQTAPDRQADVARLFGYAPKPNADGSLAEAQEGDLAIWTRDLNGTWTLAKWAPTAEGRAKQAAAIKAVQGMGAMPTLNYLVDTFLQDQHDPLKVMPAR